MKCTQTEFLKEAASLMRAAEAAEEALEIVDDAGTTRMICSCPGLKSNVIHKARPKKDVVSFFRYRPDRPLPKGWNVCQVTGIPTGHYVVWSRGSKWFSMPEDRFLREYVVLEDYEA
jgi:hypothetical protein